jgi:D-amino-acid oxidase
MRRACGENCGNVADVIVAGGVSSLYIRGVNRRLFLKASGAAAASFAVSGCRPATAPAVMAGPRRAAPRLVPVNVSRERVIRTTVGLRPHRDAGFVVRADRLDEKLLVHNYGHGGAGYSLSWGTGLLATELALGHTERRAAVIGSGIVGLTTARQLQRHGFDVTIYAAALPPDTTSNLAWAAFTPVSGLVSTDRRTAEWDEQFRRAVTVAYREHQLLVGSGFGVSWIDDYSPMNDANGGGPGGVRPAGAARVLGGGEVGGPPLLPESIGTGRVVLGPGEHPFATPYASVLPTLRFEPSIYLDALMRSVIAFGGRIVVRMFETPRDLAALTEPVIVNCTGLGSMTLFDDRELVPVKGQLVVLVPQPEVTYTAGAMMPRGDGIVLGHVNQRGVSSLDVDEAERDRVLNQAITFFGSMRRPIGV